MDTMNRLSLLTADFEGKQKVADWYVITPTPALTVSSTSCLEALSICLYIPWEQFPCSKCYEEVADML